MHLITQQIKDILCPVCECNFGVDEWKDSFDICPQCGIQFGYEDCAGGDKEYQKRIYHEWKVEWIKNDSQEKWMPTSEEVKDIIKIAK